MAGMKQSFAAPRSTRVLLAGSTTESSSSLASWLAEQAGIEVTPSGRTTAETLALATVVRPDVILLDFHGLVVSTGSAVALFKELTPAPAVFVLTHDASPAMRRRCLAAGVDAVFDKTAELEALRTALGQLAASPVPSALVPA